MGRNCRVFTLENLTLMRHIAEQGGSSIDIANTIGSTPASVKVMCCRHKIRLKRGRRSKNATSQSTDGSRPRTMAHIIRAHLPTPLFSEFSRKAEDLQLSASGLASNLLAAIATSRIYEAVLDDDH